MQEGKFSVVLLARRNRVPEGDALEFFPPAYRKPTPIRQLPEVDNMVQRDLELPAGFKNLTDDDYQLAWGFPQPGRTFYLKARAFF